MEFEWDESKAVSNLARHSVAFEKEGFMKTRNETLQDDTLKDDIKDDMLPDYSEYMKNGVRGKYIDRFASGAKFILLEPDVAAAFPDAASVNEALRRLMEKPFTVE